MVARPREPDGKRVTICAKVSEAVAGEIDAARGELTRSAWLQQAIAGALDGKLQVQMFQVGKIKPGDTVSLSASGSYPASPAVSLADALKASLAPQHEPVAVTLTETVHCPHDGERAHGPGARWYCGECGTNLPAPAVEPERKPAAARFACCKHCKHTPSMRSHDRKCGQCP